MELLTWVALALVTMLMGVIVGFGLIARKIMTFWYHLLAICLLTFIFSMTSSLIGQSVTFLSVRVMEILVGLAMIGIGIVLLRSRPSYPGNLDLILLTLALQLDVSLFSFRYGQTHAAGYGLSFMLALFLLGSIVGGMVFAQKRWNNWRIILLYPYIPSICFCLIGLVKVF